MTSTSPAYRAYSPRPMTRDERDRVEILFGGLHWRVERVIQAVLRESGLPRARPAGGDQGGSSHRPRARRHRPVLPDQLHHRQPRQLPARRRRSRSAPRRSSEQVRLPHRGLLRRLPLRPVPPELRAGAAQLGLDALPHVPDGPGQAGPEGRRWATASTSTCR